jgi:hypothetical protein
MPGGTYERYGLNGNPFRDLSSETLEDIEVYHVNLKVDEDLASIKEEVLDKENKAMIALLGPLGSGKTQRLLLAASEARAAKAFVVYFDVTEKTTWVLRGLSEEFKKAAGGSGFSRVFSPPKWLAPVASLAGTKDEKYDPIQAGRAIAGALNANAPAFLLLNDLHNLTNLAEADAFAKTLQDLADAIKPGVLVMFGAYPSYMQWIEEHRPGLFARINRTFPLPVLSAEEAALLLAKKLLAKRIVEDLEPLYPFDKAAVTLLNDSAAGNPRNLLKLADLALERAVSMRSYRVDETVVAAALIERSKAEPKVLRTASNGQAPAGPTGVAAGSRPEAVTARPSSPR